MERNPFSAQNQTLRSYRVYISPTKQASSALIQIESGFTIISQLFFRVLASGPPKVASGSLSATFSPPDSNL